jgi:septum formation protein
MLRNLEKYRILLASNSPRRKELLAGLDIDYDVVALPDVDESYPADLAHSEIPTFIARQKAAAYLSHLAENTLLITADTIVWLDDEVYGKPVDEADAIEMLRTLSGKTHEVITGVCLTTQEKQLSFHAVAKVTFATLSDEEIRYYVTKYKPYDKAGSYGVQEWIGYIGVKEIHGSFYNVMGLPIQRLYQELKKF